MFKSILFSISSPLWHESDARAQPYFTRPLRVISALHCLPPERSSNLRTWGRRLAPDSGAPERGNLTFWCSKTFEIGRDSIPIIGRPQKQSRANLGFVVFLSPISFAQVRITFPRLS